MFSSPPSPHPSFDLSCPAAPSPPWPVLTPETHCFTLPAFSLGRHFHSASHLWVVEGALLVDGVHAEVDGGAGHAVKVARVVAHRTVPCGI